MAYVYAHQRKDNGRCFYIGKGVGDRAYSKKSRNRHWRFIADKYDYNVVILVNNISDEKAYELEKSFIEQIGMENLANYNPGGSGGFSEESHKKASSPEIRKKAIANTNWKEFGKRVSQRQKGKIKPEFQSYNEKRKQKVLATNIITGEEHIFNSQMDCADALNLLQSSVNSVVNGKLKTTGNYKIKRI